MIQRVTMRQVAARAGVHSTTVSLALRNHPSLPVETRERLQSLAKEMGYRPDPMLGALMHYRSLRHPAVSPPLIFYMNPWRGDRKRWRIEVAHYQFYAGAMKRANELGFVFEHCWLYDPGMTTARRNQIIHTRNVRGVILGSFNKGRGHTRLKLDGVSWVRMDSYYVEPEVHKVAHNQAQCAQLAVRRAHKHGYRKIGFVMWKRWDEATDRMWSSGYLGESASYPTECQIPPCIFPHEKPEIFWEWFKRYSPDVVLGFVNFLWWMRRRGVRVPEDVGFIDLDVIKPNGARAGIYENHELAGGIAVDVIASMIQRNETGLPAWPVVTHINGRWVDGATLPYRLPYKSIPKKSVSKGLKPPARAKQAGKTV